MQFRVLLVCLILLIPGCFSDEERPDFNGKDLGEVDVFKFTLNDQNQSTYSLEDDEGKVVVLAFVYTRCDDVCLLIANNLKVAKSQLTEDELSKVQFVSVTIDWRHDSPEVLRNWSEDMGLDWPHLTDWNSDQIHTTYSAYDVVPYDEEDYQDIHLQPVYILDTNLKGQVVWSEYDWPIDLFLEDLRTVIDME
ncbi:MAG: SCO family protein [Candidatus Poseidoniales archaeon]|nr:MAG: SCO family protein [Candidatus Poseidoniales archaeon]